ncbi:MAG: TusE/DsrC/DsvC family sulfur relay protein [Buchnera aphidicola (Melaphis rhois)]
MKNNNAKENISWNENIARNIAKKELINITKDHWEVIYAIRNFYFKFNLTPSMRVLIKILEKKTLKTITSCYLFALFPYGPIQQGCKIAGVPTPSNCI